MIEAPRDDRHDPATQQVNFFMDKEALEWLDSAAKRDGVSRSYFLRRIIQHARAQNIQIAIQQGGIP